ncbi:MAG: hypothetical protein ACTSXC_07555 [Candidatus Freyarchaeota archaeon]
MVPKKVKDTEDLSNEDDVDPEACRKYQVKVVGHDELVDYLEED